MLQIFQGLGKDQAIEQRVKICISNIIKSCEESQIRSFKTTCIRTAGVLAERLLKKDPTIKMVYYTRDPRGMFVSQNTMGKNMNKTLRRFQDVERVNKSSISMCRRIRHDMLKFDQLSRNYNILKLRYEDLASYPGETANKLYQFIGQPLPESLTDWLAANTMADSSNGKLGTRRNSTETAERWRGILPKQARDILEENCRDVFRTPYQGYNI